eukprot:CAMPEP_0176209354 /NCGR_PEP_ID=MMETSP0121_2-20121125/13590_1 /TAXON_ID=160619 /ORGANISM="Kryptoperidinium foliaceum, Strain CCMP 1326" /LENGTH=116 /DNA_ID=CAMNT_0017548363 /DNA_START=95 /DNA_END=445 /DNA_ORIENTATION=-
MGRSAKIVRTTAFEKQKRVEKGQDWRKSAKAELRVNDKKRKAEQKAKAKEEGGAAGPSAGASKGGTAAAAAIASTFFSLDQMASGDIDMGALTGAASEMDKMAASAGKKGKKAGKR